MNEPTPKEILVYAGAGTGEVSRNEALKALRACLAGHTVRFVGPAEVRTEAWHRNTVLVVFPGGRDIPYCEALEGAGSRSVRNFVERGGSYLGFCAGAYFACREIEFERGTACEVIGPRPLVLFPGKAVGQALDPGNFRYEELSSARIAWLNVPSRTSPLPVYFEGGCYFEPSDHRSETIATYAELDGAPPAIVACRFGRGSVVLSGPHPEFSASAASKIRESLGQELQDFEQNRMALLMLMLSKLGLASEERVTHA